MRRYWAHVGHNDEAQHDHHDDNVCCVGYGPEISTGTFMERETNMHTHSILSRLHTGDASTAIPNVGDHPQVQVDNHFVQSRARQNQQQSILTGNGKLTATNDKVGELTPLAGSVLLEYIHPRQATTTRSDKNSRPHSHSLLRCLSTMPTRLRKTPPPSLPSLFTLYQATTTHLLGHPITKQPNSVLLETLT